MVGQSVTEQTVSSKNTFENLPGSLNAAGSSVLEGSTQQAINLQILHELRNIGKRIDAIEKKGKIKLLTCQKLKEKVSDPLIATDAPVTLPTQQSLVSPLPNLHTL